MGLHSDLSLSRTDGYEREPIWRTEGIMQEIILSLVHQIDLMHLEYALTGAWKARLARVLEHVLIANDDPFAGGGDEDPIDLNDCPVIDHW
jgi:hypothetical protein